MHYGIKLKRGDKRIKKYSKQRKQRGFDDSETWCLSDVICKFILPRLKRFKELNNGFPPYLTSEAWDDIIQQMIDGFQAEIDLDNIFLSGSNKSDDQLKIIEKELFKRSKNGLKLFAKHFRELWW